jgi:hypothetical protein
MFTATRLGQQTHKGRPLQHVDGHSSIFLGLKIKYLQFVMQNPSSLTLGFKLVSFYIKYYFETILSGTGVQSPLLMMMCLYDISIYLHQTHGSLRNDAGRRKRSG